MAAQYTEGPILLEKFNEGGLSDSKWSGIANSLYKLTGWDMHSTPGILKVAQKLTKDTTILTALCRARVASSNGCQYWFSYTDGKIWERPTTGTWRLVHTTTPAAGAAGCLGAIEYQGYIYWATQSRLHRILVTDADDNNWAATAVEDWATFTNTDATFHPMRELNLVLYIGDANYVAQVDAGTFSANALDVKTPLRIKSLGKYSTDLLIGTFIDDNVTRSEIFRWNTSDPSFTSEDEIPEVGINAFLEGDNIVYVQAGLQGNIYVYNGVTLELYRKIPGDYSPTAYGEVYPDAVANLAGRILFGFSNGSGNPADQGVYQIARNGYNYKYVMDMPYPISERSGSDLVLSGIEIGAILVEGSNLYVSWKHGTTYGVDKLDYSNKLEAGYLESRIMTIRRFAHSTFSQFSVAYDLLPASTAINIQYSKNYGSYTNTTEVADTDRKIVYTDKERVEATTMQLKVYPTVSGNNAPEIELVKVDCS